jgi:hypothetical protein
MNRFNSSARLLGALSVLTMVVAIAPLAQAATKSAARPLIAAQDRTICYGNLGGKQLNLDRLCGVGVKSNTIDLSIDANKDGVSDQLLVEMQRFRKVIASASGPEQYQAAFQKLEERMPYSQNVKQLQAQQRQLQKQMEGANGGYNEQRYRQLSALQEKMYKDPSYTKVQEAMSKVYQKLDR